jgi:hypothetical protein
MQRIFLAPLFVLLLFIVKALVLGHPLCSDGSTATVSELIEIVTNISLASANHWLLRYVS